MGEEEAAGVQPSPRREDERRLNESIRVASDSIDSIDSIPVAQRSDEEIKRFIEGNSLVWRFCLYGAIKNLQFFEAYLIIILLEWGYNMFQIGVLMSVSYALSYIFEVPSGVIADHFGKKNELLLCFVLYMVSFLFYAFGQLGFGVVLAASAFYGLGEAFRSGTHKAMIMVWLDRQELGAYKTFIYSRTRSYSNMGSALNAVLSVVIIIAFSNQVVFVLSVVPFVADFLMVATYPSYMNDTPGTKQTFSEIVVDTRVALKEVLRRRATRKPLLSSSCFMAAFATLKHYIQPVLAESGEAMLASYGVDESTRPLGTKVTIGVLYAIFYLCSAVGTRNSHRLKCVFTSHKMAMDVLFYVLLSLFLAIGVFIHIGATTAVLPLYLALYVVQNLWKRAARAVEHTSVPRRPSAPPTVFQARSHLARRPWSVAAVSDLMGKKRRALVLSVDSLIQTTLCFFLAPVAGYLAHAYSLETTFFCIGLVFLLLNALVLGGGWEAAATPPPAQPAEQQPPQPEMPRAASDEGSTSKPSMSAV